MKKFEYFKIETVEELKKVYHMFEDKWNTAYSLEDRIMAFNKGSKYVLHNSIGIFLSSDILISNYTEIKSPVRNINNLNKLI